jgi:hypothetical protein
MTRTPRYTGRDADHRDRPEIEHFAKCPLRRAGRPARSWPGDGACAQAGSERSYRPTAITFCIHAAMLSARAALKAEYESCTRLPSRLFVRTRFAGG